jgi:hypothetical protein
VKFSVRVVPIRIGSVAAEVISGRLGDFYSQTVSALTGSECELAVDPAILTRAVSEDMIQSSPEMAGPLLNEAFGEVAGLADVLLLDLSSLGSARGQPGDFRGALWGHLARPIESAMNSGDNAKLVVLVDELPPEGDDFRRSMGTFTEEGTLFFVDLKGRAILNGSTIQIPTDLPSASLLMDSSVTRLRRKMIRRRGWFSAGRLDDSRVVRNYYDGQLCSDELADLIEGRYRALGRTDISLAYDRNGSPWIAEPCRAAAMALGLSGAFELPNDTHSSHGSKQPSFLVIPAVETGSSLKRALDRAELSGLQVISVLAVLSTAGEREHEGTRLVRVEGRSSPVEVSYLLKVSQESIEIGSPEDTSTLFRFQRMSYEQASSSLAQRLSPFEFWDLAADAGSKLEDDVPDRRASLSIVPDFPRMVERYGTWLAYRLLLLAESRTGETSNNLLFVRPANEKGSEILAEYIERVGKARVVGVGREWLDSSRSIRGLDPITLAELEEQRPDWFVQLKSKSVSEVIFLDEFIFQGGTLDDMVSLGNRIGFTVRLALLLADFSPDKVRVVPICALHSFVHKG